MHYCTVALLDCGTDALHWSICFSRFSQQNRFLKSHQKILYKCDQFEPSTPCSTEPLCRGCRPRFSASNFRPFSVWSRISEVNLNRQMTMMEVNFGSPEMRIKILRNIFLGPKGAVEGCRRYWVEKLCLTNPNRCRSSWKRKETNIERKQEKNWFNLFSRNQKL